MTVSEVRPDGKETFVQDGWLRASERKLDAAESTLLEPVPDLRQGRRGAAADAAVWTEVTIPLYYEGHAYRAGSRIRVTISAPGGDQPIWAFADTIPSGTATVVARPLADDALAADAAGRAGRRGSDARCRRARACAASRAGAYVPLVNR